MLSWDSHRLVVPMGGSHGTPMGLSWGLPWAFHGFMCVSVGLLWDLHGTPIDLP